jgi:hypothetical protein
MPPTTSEKCTKCDNPLDTMPVPPGTAKWCKACRAAYQAEYQGKYRDTKGRQAEAQGFARGVEAMRNLIASKFAPFPMGMFGGSEVVRCIKAVEAPAAVQPTE